MAPGTALALIRHQIRRCGPAVAIEDGKRQVSYDELGALVRQFAGHFRQAGVRPGDVVGVGLPRKAELIAVLLALWAAGAAFFPVDAGHPPARLEQQLSVARARFVLMPPGAHRVAGCGALGLPDAGGSAGVELPHPDPLSVAYAMATSGSTGQPKVVGVPHGALHHCVTTFADLLGLRAPAVAATTALTFDISLLELFLPLATGGRLLLADERTRRDPAGLAAWLMASRPDLVQGTPTFWQMLLPYLGDGLGGTTILCGGETLTARLATCLAATGASVWNVYGPTEATVWCVAGQVAATMLVDPVPIGWPLPGTLAAVLDHQGREVPVGETGELYIGGAQLAVGYLGERQRTALAFADTKPIGRAYRTGDLCAWQRDGALRFCGRADNQVKLRGHRLELEEVEAHAERHPAVARAAAVLADRDPDDQWLFLYCQPHHGKPVTSADLRRHLAGWLPAELLPQQVVVVPRLPLTPGQKVDRRLLRESAQARLERRRAGAAEAR